MSQAPGQLGAQLALLAVEDVGAAVLDCDARQRESVKIALVTLLQHVYDIRRAALVH